MKPDKVCFAQVFGGDMQYLIPRFQRHYVWDKEDQWRPLWEDIESIAQKRLSDERRGAIAHFTGAIITQLKPGQRIGEPKTYEIIDGQQRLITFQIVLCAIRDVCEESQLEGFSGIAEDADKKYIKNSGRNVQGDAIFKLLPTQYDLQMFKSLVAPDDGAGGGQDDDNRILGAYGYFKKQIRKFVGDDKNKAEALLNAVVGDFSVVQIEVEKEDEPETIFQSLNGKQKPLSPFDLLRNDLFLRMRMSEDKDGLYEKYWESFESSDWSEEVKVGANRRPLSELFMQHFLTIKRADPKVSPLFQNYRRYREDLQAETKSDLVEPELKEFRRCADIYLQIAGKTNCSVSKSMAVYDHLGVTTLRPFVLYLLSQTSLSEERRAYAFTALESYAVRSVLCKTRGRDHLNVFFARIISFLSGKHEPLIRKEIRKGVNLRGILSELNRSDSPTDKWPDDGEVKKAFLGNWRAIRMHEKDNKDARYILHRLEMQMRQRSKHAPDDDLPPVQGITLEHVLPQKWRNHWLLPSSQGLVKWEDILSSDYKEKNPDWKDSYPEEGQEESALANSSYADALEVAKKRDESLHSFGNLTLLIGTLNASVSNANFSRKKPAIAEHSSLSMNREICKNDGWDVEEIGKRTENLYQIFLEIWPDPQWCLDNMPPE